MKQKNSVDGMSASDIERGYSSEEAREKPPDFEELFKLERDPPPGMLDRKKIVGTIKRGFGK